MNALKSVQFAPSKDNATRVMLRCRFWLPLLGVTISLTCLVYALVSFLFLPSLYTNCVNKYDATNGSLVALDVDNECARVVAQSLTYEHMIDMRKFERSAHNILTQDNRVLCVNSTDVKALPMLIGFQSQNITYVIFNPKVSSTQTSETAKVVQMSDGSLRHVFGFDSVAVKGVDSSFVDVTIALQGDVAHCVSASTHEVEIDIADREKDTL